MVTVEKGKRVKFSAEGLMQIARRNPTREDVIIGQVYGRTCWRILWDGIKTPDAIYKGYISIIPD